MSSPLIILDELETKLNTLKSDLSGTINTINTNVNSVKSLVETNNTASESGTLSQKMSSVIGYVKTNNTASSTGNLSQKLSYITTQNAAHGKKIKTSAGTENWVCPQNVYVVYVMCIGGGGKGGSGYSYSNDFGGTTNYKGGNGSSGCITCGIVNVVPNTTYAITVGGSGANSSFGNLISASGGNNGSSASSSDGKDASPATNNLSIVDGVVTLALGSNLTRSGYNGKGSGGSGGTGDYNGSSGSTGMVSLFW